MHTLFPKITERPEAFPVVLGGLYWVMYQVILPFFLQIALSYSSIAAFVTAGLLYHIINLIFTVSIFRPYLADSFWTMRLYKARFFSSIGLGLAVLCTIEFVILLIGLFSRANVDFFPFPFANPLYGTPGLVWVLSNPLLMLPCLILAAPISTCCLYYAVGFAPAAEERPWLGYLIVAFLSAIPAVLMVTAYGFDIYYAAAFFLCSLPMHMCSCWVYQRSDTIWAPIVFHVVANVLSIPIWIWLSFMQLFTTVVPN